MSNFNNIMNIVVIGVIGLFLFVLIIGIRFFSPKTQILASISEIEVNVKEQFSYSDSTQTATRWLWEFGDSNKSNERKGIHKYDTAGIYKIRLTVDEKYEKIFEINVKNRVQDFDMSNLVEISAPDVAMQGEKIVIKGIGEHRDWQWEFGESGLIDSKEKSTIYSYTSLGVHTIQLRTEKTKYPIMHQIEIIPSFIQSDTAVETTEFDVISQDIKKHLQNICNGDSFNKNYNYIIVKYMNSNPKTEVIINNSLVNDMYSYCQGLAVSRIGRNISIEHVSVEDFDPEEGIVIKINVVQID